MEIKQHGSWYELRADGEKRAAFGPICTESREKAFNLLEKVRRNLYADCVLQIVACYGDSSLGVYDVVIHEEHPTVMEFDINNYLSLDKPTINS